MFRKRRPTDSGSSGNNPDTNRSKRQRVVDGVKILLDIAKESSDCFPPLKSALGFVNALIKHYEHCEDVKEKIEEFIPLLERFKQNFTAAASDGDQTEKHRRSELSCVCRSLNATTLANGLLSTLEDIEKQSRALLEKGAATRFVDKGEDSKGVARLIERLREAITHYQISQQQAIYDRITNLTYSFDTLLRLHEKSPAVKTKLDTALARLDRLCSEDSEDRAWEENEPGHRTKLFGTLTLVRDKADALCARINVQGYEDCPNDIQAASGIAEDIRDALLDYQMAQQQAMYDQNCRLISAVDLSVLNNCRRARGAGYQHGDRKGCLKGTRERVLNEIDLWVEDPNKSPVFWLNGLAGTGKSTIAQTVGERAFADGLLGASFFCSRDFKDRSDLHFIFPTLAFQLAHKHPKFRSALVPLLQSNPDVVYESLYSQMGKLIAGPLKSAGISTVIVIDALDECKDEEPSSAILSVLGRFAGQIPRVKFFITGRPEPRIKTGFRLPLLEDATKVFVLHDVHPSLINSDIRLFLQHELSELAQRHRLEGWPTDECVSLLCHRAAGLFVYAVATVKFLDSNTHLPERRLDVIINSPNCTAPEGGARFKHETTLDSLYTSVLETAFSDRDPEVDSKARSTIGAVVLLVNPLPPSGIAKLIGLTPREVIQFLTLVQSLLVLDDDLNRPVKPFHKSFPDFVTDPSRCLDKRFYISSGNLHLELAMNCLRVMNEGLKQNLLLLPNYALNSEVKDLRTRIDARANIALQYASRSWCFHLTEASGDVADVVSCLRFFLTEKFLAWLELVSALGAVRGAVVALEQLMPWLQKTARDEELLGIAKDCFDFVTTFFEPINISAPHVYHSALELSPLSSIVRKLYYHQRIPFPKVATGIPDSWELSTAISSPDYSQESSVIWSPCGQFVAIQTEVTVEVRDALTFGLSTILQPTEPTPQLTGPLAYSPDGRSITCASDAAIIIWNIQTGGVVEKIQRDGARAAGRDGGYRPNHVNSSDGSLSALADGGSLRIWKYDTDRHQIPWGEYPVPADSNFHLLFSPTLQSILGHSQNTIRLWRLDGLSVTPAALAQQLGAFSCCGTYMATARRGECTVTITNILSKNTSWFIDTDIRVFELGFTGNVLLVVGSEAVVAWLLTEGGLVNGAFGNGRAGRGDAIWTVSISQSRAWDPIFSVEGEHAVINSDGDTPHIYNTRTGDVLEPTQAPPHLGGPWYSVVDLKQARDQFYDQDAPIEDDWEPSRTGLKEGWVKDREGKHLLWLPVEWRVGEWHRVQWFSHISTMRFLLQGEPITIKLY